MSRPGALGLALVWVSLLSCARGAPLTLDAIESGRQRWRAGGVTDYRMRVKIKSDRTQAGEFRIEVQQGKLHRIARDGESVGMRDPFYTVDGLFGFLLQELEMAQEPGRFWAAPAGAYIHQRAHFDVDLGYPRRYIRAVGGTEHNIVITVEDFERRN